MEKVLLTKREMEIAGLVADGYSNRKIIDRLVISNKTLNTHLGNIYVKLGVNGKPNPRVKLIRWYFSEEKQ